MQLTRLVISNITEELFLDDFSLVTLDYDMCGVVLIFNIPWEDDPNDLQKPMQTIENRLKKIQSLIAERFQIYTSIGVSLPHHGLNNLYKCHLQAQTALTELPVSDVYGLNVDNEKQTTKTYKTSLPCITQQTKCQEDIFLQPQGRLPERPCSIPYLI